MCGNLYCPSWKKFPMDLSLCRNESSIIESFQFVTMLSINESKNNVKSRTWNSALNTSEKYKHVNHNQMFFFRNLPMAHSGNSMLPFHNLTTRFSGSTSFILVILL